VFTATFCFLATCYVERKPWIAERLLHVSFVSGYVVVFLGFWQFVSRVTGLFFPNDFLYSNQFATLNSEQLMGNAIRVSGSFNEPASLAGHVGGTLYATFWLILRGDKRRFVLCLFVLSTMLVLLSTSTTGYIVLAVGVPCMMALAATSAKSDAVLRLLKVFLCSAVMIVVVIVTAPWVSPGLADRANEVLQSTLDKGASQSYDERMMWDTDAVSLVAPTFCFGAGWGSVRSSSLAPAILGGTGIWGFGLFAWFVLHVIFVIRNAKRTLVGYPSQMWVVEALSASAVAILFGDLLAGPNLNSMEAWLPLAAALGVVVRAMRLRSAPGTVGSRQKLQRRAVRA